MTLQTVCPITYSADSDWMSCLSLTPLWTHLSARTGEPPAKTSSLPPTLPITHSFPHSPSLCSSEEQDELERERKKEKKEKEEDQGVLMHHHLKKKVKTFGPAWLSSKICDTKDLVSQKLDKKIVIDLARQIREFGKFW